MAKDRQVRSSGAAPEARRRGPAALSAVFAVVAIVAPAFARVTMSPSDGRSVYDLASVIAPDDARVMERRHKELLDKTGVAIVVVTVPELEGEEIADFAVRVGQSWGVGRKGEDRGVLVALAIAERRIYIATGYGVEGFLTDGRTGAILDQAAIPRLKGNDYGGALRAVSAALAAAAASEYGVTIDGVDPGDVVAIDPRELAIPGLLALIVLAVALYILIRHPILFALFLSNMRRGGGYRGGGFGGGFGGNSGFGGFGGGGFGGGGAGRGF